VLERLKKQVRGEGKGAGSLTWPISACATCCCPVGLAARKAHLERVVHDRPNGFYDRLRRSRRHSAVPPRPPSPQRRLPARHLASSLSARLPRRDPRACYSRCWLPAALSTLKD